MRPDMNLLQKISGKSGFAAANGRYDALINNAGLPPRDGNQQQVLQVNYFGLVAFLDGMLDHLSPDAAIVNTASRAGAMWRDNIEQVNEVLKEIEADTIECLLVYNKIDVFEGKSASIERDSQGQPIRVWLSAQTGKAPVKDLLVDIPQKVYENPANIPFRHDDKPAPDGQADAKEA